MTVFSSIQISELQEDLRLDAEYYVGAGSTERESIRAKGKTFSSYFERILHPGEFTREYQPTGHLFLRAQNVRSGRIEIGEPSYVSPEVYASLPEAVANAGDLLVVRTGANVGDVAWVPPRYSGALISSHTLRLIPSRGAPVHALACFFASDVCRRILTGLKTGSAQGQINGSSLKTLHLPQLEPIESKCKKLLQEADSLRRQSEEFYPEAEAELLEHIGWASLQKQRDELHYVKNFSQMTEVARHDAEYFQPKYSRLRTLLTNRHSKMIGEICPKPTRGVQPEPKEGGEVVVIDSKAVRPLGIDTTIGERTTRVFHDLAQNAKARVQLGDVLLNSTGRGTLGRAACYQAKLPALCDNHVAILRPDSRLCDPVYLALFLNSPAGLAQSEQFQTGSSGQLEIYPEHVQQFLVFLPRKKSGGVDIEWQKKLASKVTQSTTAKAAAYAKLEAAKQIVEAFIQ